MKRRKITAGGQISLPANVRSRWQASLVSVEDLGDHVVVRPLPDDPVTAARGALAGKLSGTSALRSKARKDEALAEARRR
jgi:bifunctional DNA-binding transcriptional regulator/antitoxin component of YhaV-PrlF toxin-antitoxin module